MNNFKEKYFKYKIKYDNAKQLIYNTNNYNFPHHGGKLPNKIILILGNIANNHNIEIIKSMGNKSANLNDNYIFLFWKDQFFDKKNEQTTVQDLYIENFELADFKGSRLYIIQDRLNLTYYDKQYLSNITHIIIIGEGIDVENQLKSIIIYDVNNILKIIEVNDVQKLIDNIKIFAIKTDLIKFKYLKNYQNIIHINDGTDKDIVNKIFKYINIPIVENSNKSLFIPTDNPVDVDTLDNISKKPISTQLSKSTSPPKPKLHHPPKPKTTYPPKRKTTSSPKPKTTPPKTNFFNLKKLY